MSTTQVITGALLAVGLFEGRKGVNIWGFIRVRHSWQPTCEQELWSDHTALGPQN